MRLVPPVHLWEGCPTIGDPARRAVTFTPAGLAAVRAGRAADVVRWSRIGYLDVHLPGQPNLDSWPSPLRAVAKRWLFGTIAHVPEDEGRDVVVLWVSRPRADLLLPLEGVPPLGIRELNELLDRLRGPVDGDEHQRLASASHWDGDRRCARPRCSGRKGRRRPGGVADGR